MSKTYLIVIVSALILCGCRHTENGLSGNILDYSQYLTINRGEDFNVVISDPWKSGRLLHRYALSPDKETQYSYQQAGGTIHIPALRAVIMSNSHCRLLTELGLTDRICGVCEPEYIFDSLTSSYLDNGRIADCGNSMRPDIERIIELNPDVILVSPFEDTGYGQLEKLGIPLIVCADYMESSPLGRAEWMRFYGLLFGATEAADSMFSEICYRYDSIADIAGNCQKRPRIMLDTKSGSAWYTAGGDSYISQLIEDAGGDYVFSDTEGTGAVPLSFETVYEKANDSDIWLLKNSTQQALTYSDLRDEFKSYENFRPFQTRSIWVCDVYKTPYFEVTPFHPEILLEEFLSIFHNRHGSERTFYRPMQE